MKLREVKLWELALLQQPSQSNHFHVDRQLHVHVPLPHPPKCEREEFRLQLILPVKLDEASLLSQPACVD